jgi:CCR4-NOT transcription complex subunit 6
MFPQNPTARLPSVLQNQRMHQPVYPNYGQQGPPQHQGHVQHHQPMQPDHGMNNNGNNMITHHGNFQSGGMPNSSPFANASVLQNGGHGAQQQRGSNQASLSPYGQDQLRVLKECHDAHASMQAGSPHYWARVRARENDPVPVPAASKTADGEEGDDRRKPWSVDSQTNRQDWYNMDLSGQGFFNIAPQLCAYHFIQELFINSNKIRSIPPAIGQLRQLRHLDASYNNIESLPVELGMCTYLKNLLLFHNRLRDLPFELGTLHLLEMLGIEGNPEFDRELKEELMKHGTKFVISSLREKIIRQYFACLPACPPACFSAAPHAACLAACAYLVPDANVHVTDT